MYLGQDLEVETIVTEEYAMRPKKFEVFFCLSRKLRSTIFFSPSFTWNYQIGMTMNLWCIYYSKSLSFEAERVRAWFYNHGLLLLSVDRRRTDDHHYLTKFATTSFQKLHPLCFTPSPWWHFSFSIIAEVITWR